uniref:Uncharacterized protein n=1 Tax=Anguilla anguilla TaxID=7936 RepID=A0A0E9TDM3_ANGAN
MAMIFFCCQTVKSGHKLTELLFEVWVVLELVLPSS